MATTISDLLNSNINQKPTLNIYANSFNGIDANISGTASINNLFVSGNTNVGAGSTGATGPIGPTGPTGPTFMSSARYNVNPQPPPRQGLIGGYLIYSTDANDGVQNAIPFTTTTPQGLLDYIEPNGCFHMVDPYTLQFDIAGNYEISLQLLILSNSAAQIIVQALTSLQPYIVGGAPPLLSPLMNAVPLTGILTLPYTNGTGLMAVANIQPPVNSQMKICYIVDSTCEISLTSCLSINKIG